MMVPSVEELTGKISVSPPSKKAMRPRSLESSSSRHCSSERISSPPPDWPCSPAGMGPLVGTVRVVDDVLEMPSDDLPLLLQRRGQLVKGLGEVPGQQREVLDGLETGLTLVHGVHDRREMGTDAGIGHELCRCALKAHVRRERLPVGHDQRDDV